MKKQTIQTTVAVNKSKGKRKPIFSTTNKEILFEIRRKLVHIVLGTIIVFLIYYELFLFFLPLWLGIFVLGLFASYLLKNNKKIPLIHNFIVSFERKEELKKTPFKGALFFLAGCILSYIIFTKFIAIAAIITLFLGDTIVAVYGMSYGKIKSPINSKKHLDATLVAIAINTFFIFFLLPLPFWKVFLASFIALFAESLLPFDIAEKTSLKIVFNDNILVPLIFGLVLFFTV